MYTIMNYKFGYMKMKSNFKYVKSSAILGTILLLSGCGGGGSDTSSVENVAVAGMHIPSSVSAVTDNSSSNDSVSAMNINYAAVNAAFNAQGTDYSNDSVDSWINNPTAESIGLVNLLLCVMDGLGADNIPNGNYKTLLDFAVCEEMDGGDSTAGTQIIYSPAVVSSSRVDNDSEQNITTWLEIMSGDDHDKVIIETTIYKESSINYPFGEFTMNWEEASSVDSPSFKGVIKIYTADGKTYIKFWEGNNESEGKIMALHVEIDDAAGVTGRGIAIPEYVVNTGTRYIDKIAYNDDFVKSLKESTNATTCYDRKDLFSSVYRSNLYEKETGNRLDLKGGFGAIYANNGINYDAYFGKWGLWTQNDTDTPAKITKRSTAEEYDMVYTPGRLVKETSGTHILVDGDLFREWNCDGDSCTNTDYSWQASDSTFRNTDGTQVTVDTNAGIHSLQFDGSAIYKDNSESLGHRIIYSQHDNVAPWSDDLSGGSLNLTCYGSCPTGEVDQTFLDNQWNPTNDIDWSDNGIDYIFDKATMQLEYNGAVIKLASTVTDKNASLYMRLVPQGTIIENYWEIYNQKTSYQWNVGINKWNKGVFAKDAAGAWYEFDKPIQFAYTHTTANDLNGKVENNGKRYFLNYNGSYLGFNWKKDIVGRWVKDVNLKNGIELYTDASGKVYVNKSIGIDKTMKIDESGGCSALNVNTIDLGVPSLADYTATTKTWSDQDLLPNVSDKIKVIDGVLQ